MVMNAGVDGIRLIKCVDDCLTGDGGQRLNGLSTLADHPDARGSRVIAFLSRRLLFDEDPAVAREAARVLALHVGKSRWSGGASRTSAPASKFHLFSRVRLIFQSLCDGERCQLQVLTGCMISGGTLSRRYSSEWAGSGVIPLRMRSTLP